MSNPSTYNCESNKACKIDEYLDTRNIHAKNVYLVNYTSI